ncbi:MAG: hypothetical protein ABFD69_09385 [Candidatus Sumerlaeia bacterium]
MRFASIFIACWFLCLASSAQADVIVLKNGVRLEAEGVFDLAGAYWYYRDGERFSVSAAEVAKIVKDSAATTGTAQAKLQSEAQACEEETAADEDAQNREDFLFIRQCRYAISEDAKKNNNDFRASCARALRMIERMYEGKFPNDGGFGYHLDFLSNPLMWETLPPEDAARLKATVFQQGGPLDEFIGPWKERMRALKVKETFVLAKAAEAHEEVVRQQEIAYRATHNAQTRWAEEVERRLAAADGCFAGSGGDCDVNFVGGRAGNGHASGLSGSKSSGVKYNAAPKHKKNSGKKSGGSNKSSKKSSGSSSSSGSSGGGSGGGHHRSGGT